MLFWEFSVTPELKERIIVSKDYSPKVPFFQGIGAGIQNKYQWARSITSWFILLQAGVGNVTTWYFYYGIKDTLGLTTEQQGVFKRALLQQLLEQLQHRLCFCLLFLIRKIGKRNLFIMYVVCSVFCFAGMYVFYRANMGVVCFYMA